MLNETIKEEIMKWIKSQKSVSAATLQRHFSIGHSQAAQLLEDLLDQEWLFQPENQGFVFKVNLEKFSPCSESGAWNLRNNLGFSTIRFLKSIEQKNLRFETLSHYLQPLKIYSQTPLDLDRPFQQGLPLNAFLDCASKNIKTSFLSDAIDDNSFLTVLLSALSGVCLEKIISGAIEGDHLAKLLEATTFTESLAGSFYSVKHLGRDAACELALDQLSTDCQVLICDTDWATQLELQDVLTNTARKMGKTIIARNPTLN